MKLLSSLWTAGCLDVASACLASARCCSEINHACILEELKFSRAYPHMTFISTRCALTLSSYSPPPTSILGGFEIAKSKGMEWASTCEQLQMLQCQHVWPQAKHFVVMGREMDWTMHGLKLWCWMLCVCMCVQWIRSAGFCSFSRDLFISTASAGRCIAVNSQKSTHFN